MQLYNEPQEKVIKDLPDSSVDLVVTDMPYSISFQSGRRKLKYNYIKNDNTLIRLPDTLKEFKRVLKPDAHAYIFCSRQKLN